MQLKLKQLWYFKTIVERGSIAAASEILHIAQPPLSKALHQLEDQLKVILFSRSSRGMHPTDAGRHLYQRVGDLLDMASEIQEEMLAFSGGQRGIIRIGSVTMGTPLVVRMMRSLRASHAQLSFSLHQGDPRHLEELVALHRIEAALVYLPLGEMPAGLTITPLAQTCFRALCPQNLAIATETSLSLRQLADYPLVLMRRKSGFGVYERVLQCFSQHGLAVNVIADASDVPMMTELVRQGDAVALMPMLPSQRVEEGMVAVAVPELDGVADKLVLIYRTQAHADSILRPMIDYFSTMEASL